MAKQARGKRETPVAVHSYLHLVRKNGVHPYIKRPKAAGPKENSWAVLGLCKAYDWPTNARGVASSRSSNSAAAGPRLTWMCRS